MWKFFNLEKNWPRLVSEAWASLLNSCRIWVVWVVWIRWDELVESRSFWRANLCDDFWWEISFVSEEILEVARLPCSKLS